MYADGESSSAYGTYNLTAPSPTPSWASLKVQFYEGYDTQSGDTFVSAYMNASGGDPFSGRNAAQ